jgi:hypothetical protein
MLFVRVEEPIVGGSTSWSFVKLWFNDQSNDPALQNNNESSEWGIFKRQAHALSSRPSFQKCPHYLHITPQVKTKRPPLITLVYLDSTLWRIKSCWVFQSFSHNTQRVLAGYRRLNRTKQNARFLFTLSKAHGQGHYWNWASLGCYPPHLSPYFGNALAPCAL